jgi:hypothetical protein
VRYLCSCISVSRWWHAFPLRQQSRISAGGIGLRIAAHPTDPTPALGGYCEDSQTDKCYPTGAASHSVGPFKVAIVVATAVGWTYSTILWYSQKNHLIGFDSCAEDTSEARVLKSSTLWSNPYTIVRSHLAQAHLFLRTMTSMKEPNFHLFPQLPTELQLMIWDHCLPSRVLELTYPVDTSAFDMNDPERMLPCRKLADQTVVDTHPPRIARVCRQSREIAFRTLRQLEFPPRLTENSWYFACQVSPMPFFDTLRTQFVHLSWDPWEEGLAYCQGNALAHLDWVARQTTLNRCSFNFRLLEWCQAYPEDHGWNWTIADFIAVMRRRASWTAVILEPIVIHAEARNPALGGLFGPLGDARVQIVDVEDQDRIDRFFALIGAPGVLMSSNTTKDMFAAEMNKVQSTAEAVFGSVGPAPKFRPAVMFRLCGGMANLCAQPAHTNDLF